MVTKRIPGAKRGRPRKTLVTKSNRYELAFAEGFCRWQSETRALSRNQCSLELAKLYTGEMGLTPGKVAAIWRGEPFEIGLRKDCDRKINAESAEWRDQDPRHAYAADLMRDLRAIKGERFSRDALWLAGMAQLWMAAFSGTDDRRHFESAERLARQIRELSYWRRRIKRLMRVSAALHARGESGTNLLQLIFAEVLIINAPILASDISPACASGENG